ncbi:Telomerase protein component 1 [Varicellaria rhodocarpa]|nr:Telomerase protein component 1 [Varicellaria rhodocarpa]
MASMRNWLKDPDAKDEGRVVVVHCKAGKGRSGTVACSYLISEDGWTMEDALARFTQRRMRTGFGAGVSIPSQIRWVGYVDRWSKHGKLYVERQVEIVEVHVWGLRDGVKVAVEGFVDKGRIIKTFHIFNKHERLLVVDEQEHQDSLLAHPPSTNEGKDSQGNLTSTTATTSSTPTHKGSEVGGPDVIFRPASRIVLPSNDINIDFERRNRATYGLTMVTSVAHVWFNAFFEGAGPENSGEAASSGVFEIEWDAMDGIRGSSKKGTRAFDRIAVAWKTLDNHEGPQTIITEPQIGEPVPESTAADWQRANAMSPTTASGKDLGLRAEGPGSASMSKASSMGSLRGEPLSSFASQDSDDDEAGFAGVKAHGIHQDSLPLDFAKEERRSSPEVTGNGVGLGAIADIIGGMRHVRTNNLPDGKPEEEMKTAK